MNNSSKSNGTSKLAFWLLGALFAALMALAGFTLNNLQNTVESIETTQSRIQGDVRLLEYRAIEQRATLERLETKIDTVIGWYNIPPSE